MPEATIELPNPIPQIRATLAWARFNKHTPASWQVGIDFQAAYENQALTVRIITRSNEVISPGRLKASPTPLIGGLPVVVNGDIPVGMAILFGDDGRVLRVLSLEETTCPKMQ